jgi:hypothetical protein
MTVTTALQAANIIARHRIHTQTAGDVIKAPANTKCCQRNVRGVQPVTQGMYLMSFEEQKKFACNLFASFLSVPAIDSLLETQIQVLKTSETMMSVWMQHRHEAVTEMQKLLVCAREATDLNELANLYQQWMAASFRRTMDGIQSSRVVSSAAANGSGAALG